MIKMNNKGKKIVMAISMSSMLLFSNTALAAEPLLKIGSQGAEVQQVQKALQNMGYYQYNKITGYFGTITHNAVVKFQASKGIAQDGIVGPTTRKLLLGGSSTTTSSGTSSNQSPVIRYGSTGWAVKDAQTILKEKGYYKSAIDGIFGSKTKTAVINFQKDAGLAADGIVGRQTWTALYAPKSSSTANRGNVSRPANEVEMLSWEQVQNLWTRDFGKAVITDIDTGKSFTVVRTGGYNHADVETASAADTTVLKQIYGGSFSWERRAVIVQVDGRRIAASMAGMPHAGRDDQPNRALVDGRSCNYGYGYNLDGIKGNNMDGVIDIHFYGSKTHGTNRVDEAHQAMVRKAAGK